MNTFVPVLLYGYFQIFDDNQNEKIKGDSSLN